MRIRMAVRIALERRTIRGARRGVSGRPIRAVIVVRRESLRAWKTRRGGGQDESRCERDLCVGQHSASPLLLILHATGTGRDRVLFPNPQIDRAAVRDTESPTRAVRLTLRDGSSDAE